MTRAGLEVSMGLVPLDSKLTEGRAPVLFTSAFPRQAGRHGQRKLTLAYEILD